MRICSIDGCEKKHWGNGYCVMHNNRFKRHGDPLYLKGSHHGKSHSREYKSWNSMIMRCTSPNATFYEHYGGRGIKVCNEWLNDFKQFYADMGDRPIGMSLDRINNDGNYEPSNCKWSTQQEQVRNRRVMKSNLSGYSGIYWNKQRKRWIIDLSFYGTKIRGGSFVNLEAAITEAERLKQEFYT